MERNNPFGSVVAVSSLIAATLYVAGFAYRWSYYYNFGIQSIVLDFNVPSFFITAIELVREPENLLRVLYSIIFPLIVLNFLVEQARKLLILNLQGQAPPLTHEVATNLRKPEVSILKKKLKLLVKYSRKILIFSLNQVDLDSSFVVDLLRIILILYTTYFLSSKVGYEQFQEHIIDSPNNTLPIVSAIVEEKSNGKTLAISCDSQNRLSWDNVGVIGSLKNIRELQEYNMTCGREGAQWRLLYRNDKSIYMFASMPKDKIRGQRPLTIVLPNNDKTYLVLGN
jgi:hypothetical protein